MEEDEVAPCVIYLNCDTPLCDGKDCGGGGGCRARPAEGRQAGKDDRRDAEGILWAAEAAVAVKDFWTDSEGRKDGRKEGWLARTNWRMVG